MVNSLLFVLVVVFVDCVWLGGVVYRIVYFRLLFGWVRLLFDVIVLLLFACFLLLICLLYCGFMWFAWTGSWFGLCGL